MQTVIVQLTNDHALERLKELEQLHIIRVLKENIGLKQKLSEKYGGRLNLSDKEYTDFQEYLSRTREEWDSNS